MKQPKSPLLPLNKGEKTFEGDAFWNGYPFRGFPFGATGDIFWGVYDALFFYPPFYSTTFPYSPKCPGPYPYGYPPNEGEGPVFVIGGPPLGQQVAPIPPVPPIQINADV
ncbi:hypothetical protein N780_08070 [Pontibacillus chungwhensis BH030062]|uniref:Uncharacterized protein n=1 Tax=Pontibacillus chungwhensis BH030062 TaxID=1385513 RepID=A0A0A2USM3_9BACI|nr:hypothetical protein [Pontibacillus chungwhensis]KGP91297.1 hypothetical protein N780_08070 [Pontibacillus chungwhensis BH030062]